MARETKPRVVGNGELAKLHLQAGEPLDESDLGSLGTAVIRARANRTSPPHVFVDPGKADSHILRNLGLRPETCSEIPLRVSRVENKNGGTVYVESPNGVQRVETMCLLTAKGV